ncbi:WXG100 family type VII secretion target [Lentzea sp. CA-135723]|uniref:WXG100 family type VII secretion target n=1 Tax=Lentzea sp. CA-135723 TaxID=3239950 RepID=UPI003D917B84
MSSYHGIAGQVAELDDADEATDLISGDSKHITSSATAMAELGEAMTLAGDGLRAVTTSSWTGTAADNFRAHVQGKPQQWRDAGTALREISTALTTYGVVLDSAQDTAGRALLMWTGAQATTKTAITEHNKRVTEYNKLLTSVPDPGPPPVFNDPGQAGREQAEQMLRDARTRVTEAGYTCARVISDWIARAPATPDWWDRLGAIISDTVDSSANSAVELATGVWEGVQGISSIARMLNPLDPYNISHPQAMFDNVSTLATGLWNGVQNPTQLAKAVFDVETWQDSPARALGKLLPDIALGAVTGGSGLAGRAATKATVNATLDTATAGLYGLGQAGVRKASSVLGRDATKIGDNVAQDASTVGRHVPDGRSTPLHQADSHSAGMFDQVGKTLGDVGGNLRNRIDDLAAWAESRKADTTTVSSVPVTPQPPVRQPPQIGHRPQQPPSPPRQPEWQSPVQPPPTLSRPEPVAPPPAPQPQKFDVEDWQRRARAVMENAKIRDAQPKPTNSHMPSPDAAQRRAAAINYAQQHPGMTVDEAVRINLHREVTNDGYYVERVEAPEPPPRPKDIDHEYLQKIIDQNRHQLDNNLPRVADYAGLDTPNFTPGQAELPPGYSRTPPAHFLDDALIGNDVDPRHIIDPKDIYLDRPGQPVVYRDVDDFLAPENALWRMDDRSPAPILRGEDMFVPRDPSNLGVGGHVGGAGRGTDGDAYVSWSNSPEHTIQRNERWAGEHSQPIRQPDGTYIRIQYMEEAYSRGGIDVNASYHDLGMSSGHKEGEIVTIGMSSENVYRVWPRITHFDANHNLIESRIADPMINKNFKFLEHMRMRGIAS